MSSISSSAIPYVPVTTREQAGAFLEAQGGQMLPQDLIIAFMFKMDLSNISAFSLTCKYINALSKDNFLWEHLISEHFSVDPANEITPNNKSYLEAYKNLKGFHLNLSNSVYSKHVLLGHRGVVSSLITDKNRLFSGSYDYTIKIWDKETGKCTDTLEGHEGHVSSLAVRGNKLFSGSIDKTIKIWDLETKKCINTLKGHDDDVSALAPFKDKLYSSSWDSTLRVWNIETGECIDTLQGCENYPPAIATDANTFYWISSDFKIKGADLDSKECFSTFEGHDGGVSILHSAETKLAACSFDGKIKVWDKKTGLCTNTFLGKSQIRFLTIFGNELISISWNNTMTVWNLETGECICTFQNTPNCVHSSATVGSKIYLGHTSNVISVMDFSAPNHVIFEELAAEFLEREPLGMEVVSTKMRFLRMPEKARNEIYGELYEILKPFANDYFGCAEHAFHDLHEQTSTAEQKAQAIKNYLKRSALE